MGKKATTKKSMDRCKKCRNYDTERSNSNWVVCKNMPLDVIRTQDSTNCENFDLGEG